MLKNKIATFLDKFESIAPLWTQDQTQDRWIDKKTTTCCFGAAVAKALNLYMSESEEKVYYYESGVWELRKHLDLYMSDIESLLWLCGAGRYPFNSNQWQFKPNQVLANLAKVEHTPTAKEFGILLRERIKKEHPNRDSDKCKFIWNRITAK